MWSVPVVVTVVALISSVRGFDCPDRCSCGYAGDQREYACQLPSGNVTVTARVNSHADIKCTGGVLRCSELPFIAVARNDSLKSFSVTECELEEPLACMVARCGATAAVAVMVRAATNQLLAEHVRGLNGTRSLRMVDAAAQTSVPYEALKALPSLTEFRLRGAKLKLNVDGFESGGSLQHVELSSDSIDELPTDAFRGLSALPQLHLWDNHIVNITADSFKGLDSLERLDLSRNRLRVLPSNAFLNVPKLKQITFFANPLEEIATDVFAGLHFLERITAFDNRANLKLGPRSFANLPALKTIRLTKCRISFLAPDVFQNSSAIVSLQLSGNSISALPAGLFKDQISLETLQLNDNKIQALRSDVFWPLKKLKELNLDMNLIEVLPGQLFSGLTRLKSIRITNNRLRLIAGDTFNDAGALETVYLGNNSLTLRSDLSDHPDNISTYEEFEQQSPFSVLLQLKELDLSRNSISSIFSDWRFVLLNLKKLNLAWNNIKEVTGADLQFLGSDIIIDLRHNNITNVEVMDMPPWLSGTGSTTTSRVLLDENPFICDCNMFSFIRRLQGLTSPVTAEPKLVPDNARCSAPSTLQNRLVRSLPPDLLTCELPLRDCPEDCSCDLRPATNEIELTCFTLPKLPDPTSYGLSATRLRLRRPPINLLNLPKHVSTLILKNVNLTSVPMVPLTLKELHLTGNLLQSVPSELLKANMTLRLAGNPLNCDCAHVDDVTLLQSNEAKIADAANVTCIGGESPWLVDAARLCAVRRATILGGALAALGVLAAIIAALVYRYSLEIKLFLYSREWLRWMIHEEDVDRDKIYDAFISFSHKDEKFVADYLLPGLENGPRPFKVCVHYRDWILGEWIPAQIASSVEQSRRTIIVLSKNFVDSVWGKMEFRVAHLSAQKEKRVRVVVVLLDDAPPDDKLDAELRAYLATNTYVKWGDPWFWEKIKIALAGKRVDKKVQKRARHMGEKITKGGLNARLNSDGKIVNDNKEEKSPFTPPSL
ncbi:uncharacterized protein ACR2FA_010349 [Aphomia sociella]